MFTEENPTQATARPDPWIASAPNLRDVGGLTTIDAGRVRTGLFYRSTALNRLAGADAALFAGLGIRAVYDLRTAWERAAEPDRLPEGITCIAADVIGDQQIGSPAQMMAMLTSPTAAREALGDGRGVAMWMEHYRQFVRLDSARAAYGRLFSGLQDDARRPALVHCSTGKDRTGWAAAALLLLLGVPYDAVMTDYLRSNDLLRRLVEPLIERFGEGGGDPELLRPIMAVVPAYLDAGLDEMNRRFGTIGDYFRDGLGIDASAQQGLREIFVERP